MHAIHKVKLLAVVAGLFAGAWIISSGSSDENVDARPVETPESQVIAQPDLDCGDGPVGVWSFGTNAPGTTCARVINDAGHGFHLIKGDDDVQARLSGLNPNTPYSFLARTKKDMLFSVSGAADMKGDLVMDLSTVISPRIMKRLRGDSKLSFLPEGKDNHHEPIIFPLKGSGDALDLF